MLASTVSGLAFIDDSYRNRRAAELYFLAYNFLLSARQLSNENSIPQFFLYAHSIEIAVKSYLIDRDIDEEKVIRIGHNIEGALVKAREHGLLLKNPINDKDLDEVVLRLNKGLRGENSIRYKYMFTDFPNLKDTDRVLAALLSDAPPRSKTSSANPT